IWRSWAEAEGGLASAGTTGPYDGRAGCGRTAGWWEAESARYRARGRNRTAGGNREQRTPGSHAGQEPDRQPLRVRGGQGRAPTFRSQALRSISSTTPAAAAGWLFRKKI